MKKDLGITKDWELKIIDTSLVNRCFIGDVTEVQFNGNWEETKANAKLIADAGNTAQQCGLLPSELLKQRDELLKIIKDIESNFKLKIIFPI